MSFLQYPDAINAPNLQIWNNDTFDNSGGTEEPTMKVPWCPLQPISSNRPESLDLDSRKENRSTAFPKSPVSKKSPVPIKPLSPTPVSSKPSKKFFKQGLKSNESLIDEGGLDAEIEEIEEEIRRLLSRLEVLCIKRAERDSRAAVIGRHGRIVPAKFMDSAKNLDTPALKRIEESPASTRLRRRGISLGPLEIVSKMPGVALTQSVRRKSNFYNLEDFKEDERKEKGSLIKSPKSRMSITKASQFRQGIVANVPKKVAESPASAGNSRSRKRGVSLGPSEISTSTRFHQQISLQEVKEEKEVKKEKRWSLSVNPKSQRPSISKVSDLRKGIATVGISKSIKREDGLLTSIQPKALFQEDKNPVPSKRPSKNMKVRVVASRYSLVPQPGNRPRKWSLPEPDKEESNGDENKRSLSFGELRLPVLDTGRNSRPEAQIKGQLEIPSKVEDEESHLLSVEKPPSPIIKITESLPKIRTFRCTVESPRDSGCAKRIAELVGRRSHFGVTEDETATTIYHTLSFDEEQ